MACGPLYTYAWAQTPRVVPIEQRPRHFRECPVRIILKWDFVEFIMVWLVIGDPLIHVAMARAHMCQHPCVHSIKALAKPLALANHPRGNQRAHVDVMHCTGHEMRRKAIQSAVLFNTSRTQLKQLQTENGVIEPNQWES